MNPKSIICLICLVSVQSILAQSMSLKEFNYYKKIAYQYDINPPQLDFGYPWWYDVDSTDYHGVIFLKEDLSFPIENIAENVWVCEPKVGTAQQIWEETVFEQDYIPYFKYLVVPDSGISQRSFNIFFDCLTHNKSLVKFHFYSSQARYFQVVYEKDMSFVNGIVGIIRDDNFLQIYMNQYQDYLVAGKLDSLESVEHLVNHYYSINWDSEESYSGWIYKSLDQKYLDNRIDNLKERLERNNIDFLHYKSLINRLKIQKKWIERYGRMKEPYHNSKIVLHCQNSPHSLKRYFNLINEINKGVLKARKAINCDWNYEQLFVSRQFDKLKFIHAQMPDLVTDYEVAYEIGEYMLP